MQPLPDLCQYPHATGVLRDALRRHRTPEQRRALAASYREDARKMRAAEDLAAYAPAYEAIAAHIEAAAEDAR
jgi:hypothetical protein